MSLVGDWLKVLRISPHVAFCDILSGAYYYPYLRNSFTYKGVLKKDKAVVDYIKRKFPDIINQYKTQEFSSNVSAEKIVWTIWWQGEELAPPMIKGCIESIRNCFSDYEVVVITKYNFMRYVDIPQYIIDKVNSGYITIVHLSDILRVSLLAKYGGIWADATLYCADSHPNIEDYRFFSLRDEMPSIRYWPCKGRWNVYFMCSNVKDYPLFSFMKDIFLLYWEAQKSLIEYFLIDYVITVAYEEIGSIKVDVDSVPITTKFQDEFVGYLDSAYSEEKYAELLKANWASKLNRHKVFDLEVDSKPTFYSYMFGKYINNNKQ